MSLPATQGTEVPVCRDCAHLVGARHNPEQAKEWKCGASPFTIDSVSGSRVYALTCYEARASGRECGPTGLKFTPYTPPAAPVSPARGKPLPSADTLLGELGL